MTFQNVLDGSAIYSFQIRSGSQSDCLGYGRRNSRTFQMFHIISIHMRFESRSDCLGYGREHSRTFQMVQEQRLPLNLERVLRCTHRYRTQDSRNVLQLLGIRAFRWFARFCCQGNRRPIQPRARIETANIAHLHLCTNSNYRVCSRGAYGAPGL